MSNEYIKTTLENYINTIWANRTEIAFDNVRFKPKNGEEYIEVYFEETNSSNVSRNCERVFYLLTIIVNVPKNTGNTKMFQYADFLKANLINRTISEIKFRNGTVSKLSDLDEWARRKVEVNFHYKNYY